MTSGVSVDTLMDRAGKAVAETAWRFGGGRPVLILCGPGNNGGDGYVAARYLKERGAKVRVAASGPPQTPAALRAHERWGGAVDPIAEAEPSAILVDALFGTGLARSLDEAIAGPLARLVAAAHFSIAVDIPSGLGADSGALIGAVAGFDMTIALGALKPAHLLQPAASHCGAVILADIGIGASSAWTELCRPILRAPEPEDHKYSRGLVAVVSGDMPGAARLAALGAARAGAGYIRLIGADAPVEAIVSQPVERLDQLLEDKRVGGVLVGPGLGRSAEGRRRLSAALSSRHPLVIDADALHLLGQVGLKYLSRRTASTILTPHGGEFAALFGEGEGSKIEQTLAASKRAGAIVLHKGADSVIAAPDGRVVIGTPASGWLSTAGTGDVLAGIIAAMSARGMEGVEAAAAGLWLQGEAARRAGPAFIADDLASRLPDAIAPCL